MQLVGCELGGEQEQEREGTGGEGAGGERGGGAASPGARPTGGGGFAYLPTDKVGVEAKRFIDMKPPTPYDGHDVGMERPRSRPAYTPDPWYVPPRNSLRAATPRSLESWGAEGGLSRAPASHHSTISRTISRASSRTVRSDVTPFF